MFIISFKREALLWTKGIYFTPCVFALSASVGWWIKVEGYRSDSLRLLQEALQMNQSETSPPSPSPTHGKHCNALFWKTVIVFFVIPTVEGIVYSKITILSLVTPFLYCFKSVCFFLGNKRRNTLHLEYACTLFLYTLTVYRDHGCHVARFFFFVFFFGASWQSWARWIAVL